MNDMKQKRERGREKYYNFLFHFIKLLVVNRLSEGYVVRIIRAERRERAVSDCEANDDGQQKCRYIETLCEQESSRTCFLCDAGADAYAYLLCIHLYG
jgi:hypothetical protein